jgi:hypothetical protein
MPGAVSRGGPIRLLQKNTGKKLGRQAREEAGSLFRARVARLLSVAFSEVLGKVFPAALDYANYRVRCVVRLSGVAYNCNRDKVEKSVQECAA